MSRSDRPPEGSAVSAWPVAHPHLPSPKALVNETRIESTGEFELALELTAKAFRRGVKIAEVPTTWRDRTAGTSRFRLRKWLPKYLYWYSYALLPRWGGDERNTMTRTLEIETREPLEALVDRIYRNRFPREILARRSAVWRVFCQSWFAHYIPKGAHVLEVAAGYCVFINNTSAEQRVAVDLNRETRLMPPLASSCTRSPPNGSARSSP